MNYASFDMQSKIGSGVSGKTDDTTNNRQRTPEQLLPLVMLPVLLQMMGALTLFPIVVKKIFGVIFGLGLTV